MEEKAYTVIEAANELNISITDVYDLINASKLNAIKVGSIKILKSELLNYIDNAIEVSTSI